MDLFGSHKKSKGLTLIEILIASFLLVVVGLITWALLKSAIEASAQGNLLIQVQENGRIAMNAVQGELRQATKPPRAGYVQYVSSILYPAPSLYSDTDRLIFFEQYGLGNDGSINYQSDINYYKIVDYWILPNKIMGVGKDREGKTRLIRRTWSAIGNDATEALTAIRGLIYNEGTGVFTTNLSRFKSTDIYETEKVIVELPVAIDENNRGDKMYMKIYRPEVIQKIEDSLYNEDRIFLIHMDIYQCLTTNKFRIKAHSLDCQAKLK